jgi:hypothetical protein
MRITEADLRKQFDRAITAMPFIRKAEDDYVLPPFLLMALGSRETNLRDITGDGGHGHGIFQRDDRSFVIPAPYPVERQADDAARLLFSNRNAFHSDAWPTSDWRCAVAAYNAGRIGVGRALAAGQTPDSVTTGKDYAADVLERWSFLARWGWSYL